MKIPRDTSKRLVVRLARAGILLLALSAAGCGRHSLLNPLDPEYVGDGGAGQVVYVSPVGSGANSGLNPEAPKGSIQDGIDTAANIGAIEVRVAEGTYEGKIELKPGVSLRGGYSPDFFTHDPIEYVSLVSRAVVVGGGDTCVIQASGSETTGETVVEGLRLEIVATGEQTSETEWWPVTGIELSDGASPTIRGNDICVQTRVTSTEGGRTDSCGIAVQTFTSATAVFDLTIEGNRVIVDHISSGGYATGIEVGRFADTSSLVIAANHVSVIAGSTDLHELCGISVRRQPNVRIKNNVVSVHNAGGGAYSCDVLSFSDAVGSVCNNVFVCSSTGGATAISSPDNADDPLKTDLRVANNIFAAPGGWGSLCGEGHECVCAENNLCFVTSAAASWEDGGNNAYIDADIFEEVFSSAYDPDLSDGDDTDYHLLDRLGQYAVDLGMDVSGEEYGAVTTDIDGDARPAGTGYDMGADEKIVHAVYVSPAGSDDNTGLAPEQPKATLTGAVATAQATEGVWEIRVAEGTYYEQIEVYPGVSLKGGYSSDFLSREIMGDALISTIAADAGSMIEYLVKYNGDSEAQDVLEGFTLRIDLTGTTPAAATALLIVRSSLLVRHNRLQVFSRIDDQGPHSTGLCTYAIEIYGGDSAIDLDIVGNEIVVLRENASDSYYTYGILLWNDEADDDVLISRNRIGVQSDYDALGIVMLSSSNVRLQNNIISVQTRGEGSATGIMTSITTGSITNNTIVSYSAGSASQCGIKAGYVTGDSTLSLAIYNNILGTCKTEGIGLHVSSADVSIDYDHNLCFLFATPIDSAAGGVGASNQYEASDIFSAVFSSDYDVDVTNWGAVNYHLSDAGDAYAVDRGTDAGFAERGDVTDDIDGDPRPQGSNYDRGADEAR